MLEQWSRLVSQLLQPHSRIFYPHRQTKKKKKNSFLNLFTKLGFYLCIQQTKQQPFTCNHSYSPFKGMEIWSRATYICLEGDFFTCLSRAPLSQIIHHHAPLI